MGLQSIEMIEKVEGLMTRNFHIPWKLEAKILALLP